MAELVELAPNPLAPMPVFDAEAAAGREQLDAEQKQDERAAPAKVPATTIADLEEAFVGMKAGTVSEAEAVRVMENLLRTREAALETRLAAPGGLLESSIKSTMARLTEAPTNWHQATVFYLTTTDPKDTQMRARAPLLFAGSALMVLVQSATALAVAISTLLPSCESSDQCEAGLYCQIGFSNRCQFCGSNVPLYMQTDKFTGDTYNNIFDASFAGWNSTYIKALCHDPYIGTCGGLDCLEGGANVDMVMDYQGRTCGDECDGTGMDGTDGDGEGMRYRFKGLSSAGGWQLGYTKVRIREWCDYCVLPNDDGVHPTTQTGLLESNVNAMGTADWVALFFACFVVAFQVVGELKDVTLCSTAIARAGGALHPGWRYGFLVINAARRWIFLTVLCVSVPLLVVYKGGDALNVCFNTIAILFMTEVHRDPHRPLLPADSPHDRHAFRARSLSCVRCA
jgi:hypothetical protein